MKVKEIINKHNQIKLEKEDVIKAINGVIDGCREIEVKRGLKTIVRNSEELSQRLEGLNREYPFSSVKDKEIIKYLAEMYFDLGKQEDEFLEEEL